MKSYLYLECFIKFVEVFAETEIGQVEVDVAALAQYLDSDRFRIMDTWGMEEAEEAYFKMIEGEVLKGFPIWQFLKVSDWTKDMLMRELEVAVKEEQEALERKYACFTCKHLSETRTSMGIIYRCGAPEKRNGSLFARKREFKPKKSCKDYVANKA